jgi:hypothetical protein
MTNGQEEYSGEGKETAVVSGGFLQSIIDIFVDPMKVFQRIDGGLTWWKPYVLSSVIAMISAYFMIPFQLKRIELNPNNLPPEQVELALERSEKFGFVGIIFVPILFIIIYLVTAGIAHIAVNIMSSRANFKKMLSLVSYTGLVTILGQIIGAIVLGAKGVESIETMADMRITFSLAALFPELEGAGYALLDSLNIFNIWYYILFLLGTAAIFKISRSKALFPVIVLWAISFVIILLTV